MFAGHDEVYEKRFYRNFLFQNKSFQSFAVVLASLSFRAVASERAKAINLVIIWWQFVNFHHALYRRAISP